MSWIFRDILLVLALLVMAGVVVMELVGIAFDIDQLLEQEIGRLTGGELLIGLFMMAAVLVVWRLLLKVNDYERNKPSFRVVATPGTGQARIKVENASNSTFLVSARGQVFDEAINEFATEDFVLRWEETPENQLSMNPSDRGTLIVGRHYVHKTEQTEQNELHFLRLFSQRRGQDVSWEILDHGSNEEPHAANFTLRLFPAAPSPETYVWTFKVNHEHPNLGYWLTAIPKPRSRMAWPFRKSTPPVKHA